MADETARRPIARPGDGWCSSGTVGAVGAFRTLHPGPSAPTSRGRSRSSDLHPLLQLQQVAGNRAVTAFVQRKSPGFHSSKVALAPMDSIYEGKCDASTKGATVSRGWSPGFMGKDVSITFTCGPQTFEFISLHPIIGNRFPWGLETADGGSAWVHDPVSQGLDDIDDDIDDTGPKFWSGYHTILNLLEEDLRHYCSDD
jgi:hypothetical protein